MTFNKDTPGAFEESTSKHKVDHEKLIRRATMFKSANLSKHADEVIS